MNNARPPCPALPLPRPSLPRLSLPRLPLHCLSLLRLPPPRLSLRRLPLLCLLLFALLLSACGRRPGEPTPLPPGTPVAQPTPDFSAPAQPDSASDGATESAADGGVQALRTRLAQQRAGETSTAASPSPAAPTATPAVLLDRSLDVFKRPNALGILSGGGFLYAAPGGAVRANLQAGATLTITGRSADGAWFAAYLADGTAGWVPAAQVRVFGDAAELEVVQESLGPAVVATLIAQASQPQTPITLASPTPPAPSATDPAAPSATDPVAAATATAAAAPPAAAADPAAAPSAADPAAAAPSAAEITGPALTVTVEGANLRAGPGTGYPVVGVLYREETAALLGRNQAGDWLQLQRPDGPAWIFAPLVQTTVPIAGLPPIDPPPTPQP